MIDSRRKRWTEHAARMREMINAYIRSFGSKTLGKRLLSRSKRTWEHNDKMNVNGIRWEVIWLSRGCAL
jgi:hypothetical protein